MVENFVTIQDSLNDIFETVGNKKQMADFNKKLNQLEARINRISQSGIDQVALEQAVEAVLKRKGVI
jgi:archaellum component FlaC